MMAPNGIQSFYPYGCSYRWQNSTEICQILSRFNSIRWYGDSIVRHSIQVMTMLALNDLFVGGIPKGSPSEAFALCRCDGQLSEARICRDLSHTIFQMKNSRHYGLCREYPEFEMSLYDNQGHSAEEEGLHSSINRACVPSLDQRPRIVITNFGLHLDPTLDIKAGKEYLRALLHGFVTEMRQCAERTEPFDLYFIIFSSEPFDLSVSTKYPGQDDDNVFNFNAAIKASVDELPSHLRSRVFYFNSTAIIRGGRYVDGCHPLTESVAIRVQYILGIMRLILELMRDPLGDI